MKCTIIALAVFSILVAVIFSGCMGTSTQTNVTNITGNITKNATTTLNETKNETQIQISLPADAPFTSYNITKSKSQGVGLPPEPPE